MKLFIKILLLVLFSVFSSKVSAQEIEWQNTIGGNDLDRLWSIQNTVDGGFICGGTSLSNISGDKTENNLGGSDFWIVKLDINGYIQWQNTIGGSGNDNLQIVSQTSDGGYICGGASLSNISSDKSENCYGDYDYWVVKLDSVGNILWQNTIGGSGYDYLVSIQQTVDGGFICGGYSNSPASGDKSENSIGNFNLDDCWIVKLDSSGNIQWQNTIGGNGSESLSEIEQTSDGGFICASSSDSNISGDKNENSLGGYDFWVLKLSAAGVIQWQNTIGGSGDDFLQRIQQCEDGSLICGGKSDSNISGDILENSLGFRDFWTVKLNSTGNILWQNKIGGDLYDELTFVQELSNSEIICGGYSKSDFSGDKLNDCKGDNDFWVVKLDANGKTCWQSTIGGSGSDVPYSVCLTNDGDFVMGGASLSNISGDKTENSHGFYDYWVVKISFGNNVISGNIFEDLNANSIKDSSEIHVPNKAITETNSGRMAFSDQNGNYHLIVADSGNYEVAPSFTNYYSFSPGSHTVMFSSILQTDSLNDFAFQPNGVFNDLCLTITPVSPLRTGMNAVYIINYTNQGNTTLSPTVIFYPDNNLSYVSSVPTASTIFPDSIIFTFGPISPFQSGQILVTVNVNQGLAIGSLINSGATILPVSGDANPACNTNYYEALTIGSIDPNDILVNRESLFNFEIINPEPLEYIIRFQNTGNDTAFYVRIDNKISADLQHNTFEFVTSSHPLSIEYQSFDSAMKFTFNNILLPDSNINEPESHGFVRYKIKPQTTLQIGDSIRNSAGIYFDYNAPVWTNTAVTEIVLSTGLSQQLADDNIQLLVYPNPVNQVLSVEIVGTSENNFIIDLYNMYGQKVNSLFNWKIPSGNRKIHFDVSELRSGMYFIKAEGSFSKPVRFIKY